jgi:hypothetical protein
MKIQAELKPMSELPPLSTYGTDIIVCYDKSAEPFTFYNKLTVISRFDKIMSWSEIKADSYYKGWCFFHSLYSLKFDLENEEEQKSEQLTIVDLINEAKEKGYKYIGRDENNEIYFYKFEVKPLSDVFYHLNDKPHNFCTENNDTKNKGVLNVKKWYEGDWKNSLIEVK